MLTEVDGKIIDCNLIRLNDEGIRTDHRTRGSGGVTYCTRKEECATCMWNAEYAAGHKKELELQDMTEEEINELKARNTLRPITATKLRCYKVKKHEPAV